MTACLLDTCILIDVLRNRNEAVEFLHREGHRPLVSVVTAAELFAGVRTEIEQNRIDGMLDLLSICQVDLEIARLGGAYSRQYRRSHGVAIPDALIAATARVHGVRLVTRNVKHFPMLDDVLVPYQ